MLRLLAVLWVLVGCNATPVPEPPNLLPPDLERVEFMPATSLDIFLVGQPGALEPGVTLHIVDLDGAEPPVRVVAAPDGSFSANIVGVDGDELRLTVRDDSGARSEPIDLIAPSVVPIVRPLDDCLFFDPARAFELEEGPSALLVQNNCIDEVTIDTISLRVPTPELTVQTTAPLSIAAGASTQIDLSLDSTAAVEEVLLFSVSAPSVERRPITLFGIGMR